MKHILALFVIAAFCFISFKTDAQIVRPITATKSALTSAASDTAYATLTPANNVVSIAGIITKVAGTVGGTMVLQGTLDGSNWDAVTSYTITDVAAQQKVFDVSTLIYKTYRLRIIPTGSGASVTWKAYCLSRGQ